MSASPDTTWIAKLRTDVTGRVVTPDDQDYDAVRQVFLGDIDERPAAVVRVANALDVSRAVAAARETGLDLAVRSGGHSAAGHSATTGGIVIDRYGDAVPSVAQAAGSGPAVDQDAHQQRHREGGRQRARPYSACPGQPLHCGCQEVREIGEHIGEQARPEGVPCPPRSQRRYDYPVCDDDADQPDPGEPEDRPDVCQGPRRPGRGHGRRGHRRKTQLAQ